LPLSNLASARIAPLYCKLVGRIAVRAGLVNLRQTFVRRSHESDGTCRAEGKNGE
jgi:hypothetical protein